MFCCMSLRAAVHVRPKQPPRPTSFYRRTPPGKNTRDFAGRCERPTLAPHCVRCSAGEGVTLAPGAHLPWRAVPGSSGENPRGPEPCGSSPRETLRYAQSDILRSISSKLDTPGKPDWVSLRTFMVLSSNSRQESTSVKYAERGLFAFQHSIRSPTHRI